MARLIEIENVIRVIDRYISDDDTNLNTKLAITNIPKIEAEPVVRCKDCKFYWKNNRDSDGVVCLATPKDDAFCSEGERREDANS